MIDLGTVLPGDTIRIPFSSFDKDDGSSITMTNYAVGDILIYKDGDTTARASTSGFTATTDFSSKTGKHVAVITLSDNTTAGFFAAGSEYLVAVDAVTVDGVTTGGWIARFRIGYRAAILDTTIATLSSQTSFTLTAGPAENDALKDMWAVIHDVASAVQKSWVLISAYTGSTKTVTLAAGATFTVAAGDNISIMFPAPMQAATVGRKPVVDAAGLVDANAVKLGPTGSGTALTARDIGLSVLLSSGTGTGQLSVTSGLLAWNPAWDAEVQSEVDDALVALKLDHLVAVAESDDPADNSIIAKLASATGDWSTFVPGTDSLEANQSEHDSTQSAIANVQSDTNDLQVQIGTAGNGLTAVPWNAAWDAEVQSEVQDAIEVNQLDHLIQVADPGAIVANSSLWAKLHSKSATPAYSSYNNQTDSLEAHQDNMGAAGAGLSAIPWNSSWDSEVESEANDALVALKLDHLVAVAESDDPADNSIIAKLASATGDWSTFVAGTDSLEANQGEHDSTQSAVATVDSVVDAILLDTGTDGVIVASLSAAAIDSIHDEPITEPSGMFAWASATHRKGMQTLMTLMRNEINSDSNSVDVRNDADNATLWSYPSSDDGSVFTSGEAA